MKNFSFWILIIAVAMTSCRQVFGKRIRGNGNLRTETRSSGEFHSVDVSGNIDVYVKYDSAQSIQVETDGNLLEYVDTHNDGGTLHIHERDGYNLRSGRGIKVYVAGPDFKHFEASGACDINGQNQVRGSGPIDIDISGASDVKMDLNAPAVTAELSGACSVALKGQTRDLKLDGSGSSSFKCFDLLAENVDVEISGAGNAEVFASVKLDVNISGAANVKYKGNASIDQRISGAGSVNKVQ